MMDATTKTCSECELVKPFTAFSKDKQKKDGVRSCCKECINRNRRERLAKKKEQVDGEC